jgi:hypothetical protein
LGVRAVPDVSTETVTDHLGMAVPIPPVHPDGGRPRVGARAMPRGPDEDEVLLRRLDANELYDIHRGLDWCERELRALGLLRLTQRWHVAALRRRWAHRWRAATGRPAVSLHAHRAWKIAATLAASAALTAIVDGSDQPTAPPEALIAVTPATVTTSPVATATPTPVPTPMPQATGEPMPTGQPGPRVTDRVAQSRALRTARRLERCWRHRLTFLACGDVVVPTRHQHVVIGDLTQHGFMLTATAGSSGNHYTVQRVFDGSTIRTCTMPDTHGCRRNGRW